MTAVLDTRSSPPIPLPAAPQRQTVMLFRDRPLLLDSGRAVHDVVVAYHAYGAPSAHATLILHALTGDSAAHAWWPGLVGAGRAIDPAAGYVVCSNVIGGCAGSSGPQELGELTLHDMAAVQRELLAWLGVQRVTLVGGSMGGMQAYAWLSRYPDLVQRAVIIGAPARHSAWATGLNVAQRGAIAAAPGGQGLKVARMMAMLSYRSPESLASTQSGPSLKRQGLSAVQSYLEYQGDKLEARFCEHSYVALTSAMDRLQLSDAELRCIGTRTLVVGIRSDLLYPAAEVRAQAELLPRGVYWELDSPHGHDAFLMDGEGLNARVAAFLAEGEEGL